MIKTVCFTGHRQIPEEELLRLGALLREVVEAQIAQGAIVFRTGGALGFDTLAALTVLALRKAHPHIRLELYLPCPSQTRGWSASDRQLYTQILEQADAYHYASTGYYPGVLQMRNRALVDHADILICYVDREGSGSSQTMHLAEKKGIEVYNLYLHI